MSIAACGRVGARPRGYSTPVTAAMEGRPSADQRGAAPTGSFVVRPDRHKARRWVVLQSVVVGLMVPLGVLSIALALASDDIWWHQLWRSANPFLVVAAGVWSIVTWNRFRSAGALAEVSPWGIRINDMGRRGWVALPWEAVGSVRTNLWGRIAVKPSAGVGPSTPGTEWPASRSTARRARRKGLLIFVQPSDMTRSQVLAAITHFSGGRF